GEVDKLRAWFGMEPGAAHATTGEASGGAEAQGEPVATTEAVPAEGVTAATETAPAADRAAAKTEAAPAAEAPAAGAAAAVLATGAVTVTGTAPKGAIYIRADNLVIEKAHEVPKWVKLSPFIAMLIGLFTAWMFYIRDTSLPVRLATQQRHLYQFLLNKWYFDEIYDFLIVRSARWLGEMLWKRGDGDVIDGSINGVAMGIIPFFTRLAGRAQSGYIFHYAFAMVLGIVLLVTWMTLFVAN
ncbi:MAG: NADH-quinone oxidoreductase subunit L, partial [Pseudomonadota bacterium]